MAFNRNFPIALQIGCEKDKVKINSIQFLLNKCNLHDHEIMKYWKSPLPSPFCVYPFSCVIKLLTWRIQKGIGLRFAPWDRLWRPKLCLNARGSVGWNTSGFPVSQTTGDLGVEPVLISRLTSNTKRGVIRIQEEVTFSILWPLSYLFLDWFIEYLEFVSFSFSASSAFSHCFSALFKTPD